MRTKMMDSVSVNLSERFSTIRSMKSVRISLLVFLLMVSSVGKTYAHCDTMDGPLVADARKALSSNNVNYVLKWVPQADENEIIEAFNLVMKVRGLSHDAGELADMYFFETVVRVHRAGEGVPFTGVKPSGSPVDERVKAADKSIEEGNLSPMKALVEDERLPELKRRFEKVMSLKEFDINDVEAGREYVEAYVQFFKYAEGEEEEHGHDAHGNSEHGSVKECGHNS